MSNLDPFTQKLLERTQARKEAARNNRNTLLQKHENLGKGFGTTVKQYSPSKTVRPPLANKNETLSPEKSRQTKRHSSEGIQDSSFEKKPKRTDENDTSGIFARRQNLTNSYVVPSTAGRTPLKVKPAGSSSLSSRLASLNQDYEEKFQVDLEEQQRNAEFALKQERLKQEHKQQLEKERSQKIQERIFGKNYLASKEKEKQKEESGKRYIGDSVAGRAPIKSVTSKKSVLFEAPSMTVTKHEEERKKMAERQERTVKTHLEREQEEKMESASVCDKKSIFEQKMKEEREARAKEIETEKRLRQKTTRQQIVIKAKELGKPVAPERIKSSEKETVKHQEENMLSAKQIQSRQEVPCESEEEVEVDALMMSLKSPLPSKGQTGMLKHTRSQVSKKEQIKENKELTTKKAENSIKNYSGDINSPQPIDYTEDTTVLSDSKAFDVSSILRVADQENRSSPNKTPHRSSTMKIQSALTPAFAKPLVDIDLTPVTAEDSEEEMSEEESLSEFAKQLRSKKSEIETNEQTNKLAAIHQKTDAEIKKERPPKPPRAMRHSVHENGLPPSYNEFIADKKDSLLKQIFPDEDNLENVVTQPVEISPHKSMRRSISLSEGLVATPVKSGYHDSNGDKYHACSSFDKPDIAFSKRDQIQNLLEEAAYQQNIVLQTSQALNVAESSTEDKRGSPEVIEGERLLLLATEKRTVCLEEVRELKQTNSVEYLNELQTIAPCRATLALTDMKLPLHHDFVSALRAGRMDLGVFHFVIIASCGSKNVFSSKVISTYEEMEGHSLLMHSNILMSNVPHDFTLTIKVYGLHTKKGNDPHSKIKRTYTNSQSPGNLKNLFSKRKDDDINSHASPQTVFRTSSFKLVGETKINLNILGNGSKHVLTNVPSNCPIEGFVQLRVGCKPEFSAAASGFLTILEDVGGYTAWNRRWCNMKDNKVLYWRYPDDEETKEPIGCIDLRFCSDKIVKLLSRDKCARPHTFELNLKRARENGDVENLTTTIEGKNTIFKYWVCADNKDDRLVWMDAINKQLFDSRAWLLKHATKKSSSGSKSTDIVSSELGKAFYV